MEEYSVPLGEFKGGGGLMKIEVVFPDASSLRRAQRLFRRSRLRITTEQVEHVEKQDFLDFAERHGYPSMLAGQIFSALTLYLAKNGLELRCLSCGRDRLQGLTRSKGEKRRGPQCRSDKRDFRVPQTALQGLKVAEIAISTPGKWSRDKTEFLEGFLAEQTSEAGA